MHTQHTSAISRTIEYILSDAGCTDNKARHTSNHWLVQKGSAEIEVFYHEDSGLVIGDATLCTIDENVNTNIYAYLLRENHRLENLTFSVNENCIVLSLLIHDKYLNQATGAKLFQSLFEMADHYDDILVEEYGAKW